MNPLRNTDIGPRLKLALLALIPVVIVGVVLDHSLTAVVKSRALSSAQSEAQLVSRGVFEPRVSGRAPGASHTRALHRAFAQFANTQNVAGATLWSRRQRPLVTVGESGGRAPANPANVRSALGGMS